jgi:hypothetical protein
VCKKLGVGIEPRVRIDKKELYYPIRGYKLISSNNKEIDKTLADDTDS